MENWWGCQNYSAELGTGHLRVTCGLGFRFHRHFCRTLQLEESTPSAVILDIRQFMAVENLTRLLCNRHYLKPQSLQLIVNILKVTG